MGQLTESKEKVQAEVQGFTSKVASSNAESVGAELADVLNDLASENNLDSQNQAPNLDQMDDSACLLMGGDSEVVSAMGDMQVS